MVMEERELLRLLANKLSLDLGNRFSPGSWGAFRAVDRAGRDVVLKLLPDHPGFSLDRVSIATTLAERIRELGGPVARYLDIGEVGGRVFSLQEAVSGESPQRLTLDYAKQLVEIWRIQRHAAQDISDIGRRWAENTVTGLRKGSEDVFVSLETVELSGNRRVKSLLRQCIEVGRVARAEQLRTADVVHADLHHQNTVVIDGRIAALVDWEGAHPGDSRSDLIALASAPLRAEVEPAAQNFLEAVLEEEVPHEVLVIFAALATLQRLTFAVRTRPDALAWALETAETIGVFE